MKSVVKKLRILKARLFSQFLLRFYPFDVYKRAVQS